ncbi:hypothetical protein T4E_9961 [Trichinella pseudospiralis]|uniref:Uncharacterized protein n=1 Tax=Trichinella pseudospiralis TaxID=6337 RepID=A0A0V0XDR6_TRIPS|nr:hypothetical protein T4E_9961 [Trichinella pseudospiralis]
MQISVVYKSFPWWHLLFIQRVTGLPQWRRPLVRIPLLVDLLLSALKGSEEESKRKI